MTGGTWTRAHDRALARAQGSDDDDDEPEPERAPGPRAAWHLRPNGRRCKYPAAQLGDAFGSWTVTRLLAADSAGNERVEATCSGCKHSRATQVANLRAQHGCGTCRRAARALSRSPTP